MKSIRTSLALMPVVAALCAAPASAQQCCLGGLFAGCGSCFRTAPTYAVAPVAAPMVAPMVAPIPAPPPPVMVPVQQTSYVPETTYRTQYQCVPVTTYKPSCEVDPCTGCPTECMQPVTQYVQQAVNVPVTQYRAVTTTKYVQMQPGYAPGAVGAPVAYPAGPALPGPATPAASPFATPAVQPAQPVPQGWGAASADVSQQLVPGQPSINPPALPATGYPATQVMPQADTTYLPPAVPVQPQPTAPPNLTPTPALKPIPELPRTTISGTALPATPAVPMAPALPSTPAAPATGTVAPPSLLPGSGSAVPGPQPSINGGIGTPMLQGSGPTGATRAFPRLLEPTHHTTSWQPATNVNVPAAFTPAYPTAALPSRLSR